MLFGFLLLFTLVFTFDAVLDLGCGVYQVGTLKKGAVGNPIDLLLNSQSKRLTPSLVAYDGEAFFVGEFAEPIQRRTPGLVFKSFLSNVMEPALSYAGNASALELSSLAGQPVATLLTALISHIAETQINRPGEVIDVTLTVPPGLSLPEISMIRNAIEAVPNLNLLTTVPIPVATTITYLSSRLATMDRSRTRTLHFVVIDSGYHSTDVSIVDATLKADSKDVIVRVMETVSINAGGHMVTERLLERHLPNLDRTDLRKYQRSYETMERGKITLSANTETKLVFDGANQDGSDLHLVLTRDHLNAVLDEVYKPELLETFTPIREGLGSRENTTFYFYGAATRALHLQELFENFFNTSIQRTVNVEEGAIYGAALVAAMYGSGYRVSYKFISSDQTRPMLEYLPSRLADAEKRELDEAGKAMLPLLRLSPLQQKSSNRDIFSLDETEFIPQNVTLNYTFQMETPIEDPEENGTEEASTETDDANETEEIPHLDPDLDLNQSSLNDEELLEKLKSVLNRIEARRTKVHTTLETRSLPVSWLTTTSSPFYHVHMSASNLLDLTCDFSLPEYQMDAVMRRHFPTGIIQEKDLPSFERLVEDYDKKADALLQALQAYAQTPDSIPLDQRDIHIKIILNVSTDSASLPRVEYAGLQIQDWAAYNKEMKTTSAPKAKVPSIDLEFHKECNLVLGSSFWGNDSIFEAGYKLVSESNRIRANRNKLDHITNEIESVVYHAKELLEIHAPSLKNEGDHLIYADEGVNIREAITHARDYMEELEGLPPCIVNETCVETRLLSAEKTIDTLKSATDAVLDRLHHIRCLGQLGDARLEVTKRLDARLTDLDLFLGAIRKNTGDVSVSNSTILEAFSRLLPSGSNVTASEKNHAGLLTKLTQASEICENLSEIDLDGVFKSYEEEESQLKTEEEAAKLEQQQKSWLTRLISRGDHTLEERQKALLQAKEVIHRLRKGVRDCEGYRSTIARIENHLNLLRTDQADLKDLAERLADDMKHRPTVSCNEVNRTLSRIESHHREMTRQVSALSSSKTMGKIGAIEADLRKISEKLQQGLERAKELYHLLLSEAYDDAAKYLQEKYNLTATGEQLEIYAQANALEEPNVHSFEGFITQLLEGVTAPIQKDTPDLKTEL
ncbi:Heat shock protein 70 [Giardia muris]|uniref:Heat shock protein 70 n=1 Tax=Giardia muris TaxID=5742 RepID=A0A4Z1TC02_GIAMU|nr:Heat shock protein 70 [Giardia muris]|eukprot:TNJ30069.1 Heat shock protein 70 [Giardia muris]